MTIHPNASAITFFILTFLCSVVYLVCHYAMIRAINRHPERKEDVAVVFNYPSKRWDMRAQFRLLYPSSILPWIEWLSFYGGAVCFLGFVSAVGLIRWDVILSNIRNAFT